MTGEERTIPRHIAVIMDGNGRWAVEQGLEREEGHRAGRHAARRFMRAAQAREAIEQLASVITESAQIAAQVLAGCRRVWPEARC